MKEVFLDDKELETIKLTASCAGNGKRLTYCENALQYLNASQSPLKIGDLMIYKKEWEN